MKLSDLAALGGFISSIAVVVSLVFLTLQLRQNAQAAASSSMSAWLGNFHGMLLRLSGDSELTLTVRKGLADFDQLPANEQMRFNAFMSSMLLNSQFVFHQLHAGAFDRQIANQILGLSTSMLQTKGGSQWWELMHSQMASDFEAEMNSLVQAGKSKPRVPWLTEPVN